MERSSSRRPAILAVKRKISGVRGQSPRFKEAPFLSIWLRRAGAAWGADQGLPVAARMRSPHSISNWFRACFQCWTASHLALAFRSAR
jgi:hypothetical protein